MNTKHFRQKLRYFGFAFIASAGIVFINIFLSSFIGTSFPYFLGIAAVILSAWYGGLRTGIFATVLIVVINAYLFGPIFQKSSPNSLFFIQILNFILEGILASFVVEKCIRTDTIHEFEAREENYVHELGIVRAALKHAEEEVRARDEFLSIASHELKTPLTSMLLQLQSVLHNIRNVSLANFSVEKLMKMLISAETQTKRLSKMINDLLNVSLITTGKLELELEKADFREIVKSVIDNFAERLKKEEIELTYTAEEELIGMWDKIRIEQAVTNLITNAIKYGNKKPIDIKVYRNDDTAVLTILDEGIGISKDLRERIFARFERGVSGHDYEGLGVGLYITNQIIAAHHGTINVRSRENYGSTFKITLPITE